MIDDNFDTPESRQPRPRRHGFVLYVCDLISIARLLGGHSGPRIVGKMEIVFTFLLSTGDRRYQQRRYHVIGRQSKRSSCKKITHRASIAGRRLPKPPSRRRSAARANGIAGVGRRCDLSLVVAGP